VEFFSEEARRIEGSILSSPAEVLPWPAAAEAVCREVFSSAQTTHTVKFIDFIDQGSQCAGPLNPAQRSFMNEEMI